MTEHKTWADVWAELKSPTYWWRLATVMVVMVALAATNKWVIHIPGFPTWVDK